MNNKMSDFNILKILGVIPSHFEPIENKKIKVRCPFHDDEHGSLVIDEVNEINERANLFSSSMCHACAGKDSNTNIAKYWLQKYTNRDPSNNKDWSNALKMFNNMRQELFKDKENFEDKEERKPIGVERSYTYDEVKKTVLTIFDEEVLYENNQNWETALRYMVNKKDLGVERQNTASPWNLLFKVWFGKDYHIGSVRYQPNINPKVLMQAGTPTGLFMPFYFGEVEGDINPNQRYDSNLFAKDNKKQIFIVEGQKDMLALRLLGIPAITITGGANALAKIPEMFTDKDIYIIYDNDEAGYNGSRALGLQLIEYAKTIKVATGVYSELEDKEDAFDFFFKYKKTKRDFHALLTNDNNFEVYDKDTIEREKKEAEKLLKSTEHLKTINKIKQVARNNEITFDNIYDVEPHSSVKMNARLDEAKTESAHSIYTRPILEIKDFRKAADQINFNINKDLKDLRDKVNKINSYHLNEFGVNKFNVRYDESNEKGTTLITNFVIERIIDNNDFDIIEKILLGRNGENEASAYDRAGCWKEITNAVQSFSRNVNKKWRRSKANALENDSDTDNKLSNKDMSEIPPLVSHTGAPIIISKHNFNKKYVMDFTQVKIYEDKSHNEMMETIGSHIKLYIAYVPSYLLKSDTKIGDRITLYGGKLKKLYDNMPYFVAWHFDYRDPIEEFQINDEVKESIDKLRFRGETLDELEQHQNKMYHLWRYQDSSIGLARKMWESGELVYASIARSTKTQNNGNVKTFNSTLDALFMGDSRTGKSKGIEMLRDIYRVGTWQEMLNATSTSLIGGSDTAKKNQIVLGKLPLNHRGLVQLDELSAISFVEQRQELYKKLHVMRMDGETMITRVSGEVKAPSDVRLITTSNTISRNGANGHNPSMRSYLAGSYWKAVQTLLPSLPVLNRFSFVYMPTTEEYYNEIGKDDAPHKYSKILDTIAKNEWKPLARSDYRNKINWIWSRKPENVVIDEGMNNYINEQVHKKVRPVLHIDNGEEIGIYTDGTTPSHITNMAIAVAASVMSVDDKYENLIVKKVHVDYAIQYLLSLYGKETGIPEFLESMRKVSVKNEQDMELIFGNKILPFVKFHRNKVITLSEHNDIALRAHMYDLYESLYNFSIDGGEGASTGIAWAHVYAHFDLIQSRWNEIINNPHDPSRTLYDMIQNEIPLSRNAELVGSWKTFMTKIGIIKERANQKQTFFLQPKFTILWNDIKEKYSEKYDLITHELKEENNG